MSKTNEQPPKADKTDFAQEAASLMKANNLKAIWRCPKTGHWFTREDYAKSYESENETTLEHYEA